MTVLVGYPPEAHGRGGLDLAALLARSGRDDLVVCCVVPDRWEVPSMARVDGAYAEHLRQLAEAALAAAREVLEPQITAEYVVRTGRSVPTVLLDEAAKRSARILVTASSAGGALGNVTLGSVTGRLLHGAPLPLAVAPHGYRSTGVDRVVRMTVAVDGTPASGQLLAQAARMARDASARLRVVMYAVRGRTMYPPEVGLDAEDAVVAAWREQAQTFLDRALRRLAGSPDCAQPEETRIVDGIDWSGAVTDTGWTHGDVLVLGSSRTAVLARVFLGSTATHIVRHSPVPVLLLPAA